MSSFGDCLGEIAATGGGADVVRRKYLDELHQYTERNIIAYYSGWLQKVVQREAQFAMSVNDSDKNGFMATIHGLDRSKGLDLILHTPGGSTAATESIVDYLRAMFGTDIRAFVPQLALSAGTMIACACKEIVMGKHSSLGPIDPQIGGVAAHGIVEEWKRAQKDICAAPRGLATAWWNPILSKYHPTLVGDCEKAIEWSEEMVGEWLTTGMFDGDPDAKDKVAKVITEFGEHAVTKSHDRHISAARARDKTDLKIVDLEADPKLQDAVLSVHHSIIISFMQGSALKIIENHNGTTHCVGLGPPTGTGHLVE